MLRQGMPREAKQEYELCERLAPEPCSCAGPLGEAALQSNLLDTALDYFEIMTRSCPEDPEGHLGICRVLSAAGRCDDARAMCAKAAELSPGAVDEASAAFAAACGP
jgi:hypothetical protein